MFSKFLKFATGATMLALLGFGANNAQSTSLTPGMTFGIGAEWMFHAKKNSDFSYLVGTTVPAGTGLTASTAASPNIFTFDMKRDNGYGGSVSFGYLMDSGFEGGIEVLYKNLKYKDGSTRSTLETDNWIGLLKGTYYVDLGSMIYPYITAGIGIAHVNAKGTIYNTSTTIPSGTANEFVKFSDLKANKLAGDAGIGIAAAFQSALVSLGLKVSGNQHISDNHSHSDMKVYDGAGAQFTNNSEFTFGKLTQINYEVEAKIKLIMG